MKYMDELRQSNDAGYAIIVVASEMTCGQGTYHEMAQGCSFRPKHAAILEAGVVMGANSEAG